jgi:DMSO/TMAO reductase YedYZ molybdopterin-dependent catalytic subunit
MQVLRQHKKIVLLAVLLIVTIVVLLFFVQNISKPSQTPESSPVPTKISPTPTGIISNIPTMSAPTPILTSTPSPAPTSKPTRTTSPTPTTPTSTPMPTSTPTPGLTSTPTSVPPSTTAPTPTPYLYPGEVTQYQGQTLTPVRAYIEATIQYPDVAIAGTQYINQTTYRLTITGLVNKTLIYPYDDVVNNFPSHQLVTTLLCVEGWDVTMLWQGVRLSDLLKEAGANPNATTLIFSASDDYTTALPLNYTEENNLILAYRINNVTLPASTGWPFILVAQNQYGYKWIMWLTKIEVSNDSSYLGYWESRGFPNDATITDGLNNAINGSVVEPIVVSVAGLAVSVAIFYTFMKTRKNKLNSAAASYVARAFGFQNYMYFQNQLIF